MRLGSITIEGLRGFGKATTIEFGPGTTLLIGSNNVGKSTVLDAVAAVLSHRRGFLPFREEDFHSTAAPVEIVDVAPIAIELVLVPNDGRQFDPLEVSLTEVTINQTTGTPRIRLRWSMFYNKDPSILALDTTLERLDEAGAPIDELPSFPYRTRLPLRAFGLEREAGRGLSDRQSDFRRLLSDVRPTAAVRKRTTEFFLEGTRELVDGTPALKTLATDLQQVITQLGLGSDISFEAVPQDVDGLMRQLSVVLGLTDGERPHSARSHGMGTQGAIVFAAYCASVKRLASARSVSPVLTVEEPELHLHPTAQTAFAEQLRKLPGQVIASTHAPHVLGAGPVRVIALYRRKGAPEVYEVDADAREAREHAEALFSRCVLICEGLEAAMVPVFDQYLGVGLAAAGVAVINARGQGAIGGLSTFFRAAGIPAVAIADCDDVSKLRAFLKHRSAPLPTDNAQYCDVLRTHDYFVPRIFGSSLETALAAVAPKEVDLAFEEEGEASFDDWRERNKSQKTKNDVLLAALSDSAARAWRLTTSKETVLEVSRQIVKQRGAIPEHIELAMRCALDRANCK